jgi:aspartate racemase
MMSDRIVGILGGMGPEATADLYQEIIRATPARTDQEHIRVLIYSNPKIPDRTRAILEGGESPVAALLHSARVLENAGAGILAMPCNAAHYFLPRIESETRIPWLNMILETYRYLSSSLPRIRTVGLLAATGTVRSGIYKSVFGARGVETVAPDDACQELVHASIMQVKSGRQDENTRRALQSAGAGLVRAGAEAVILGCTEIPLAFDSAAAGYPTVNPTRVLAQAAVDWALGRRA